MQARKLRRKIAYVAGMFAVLGIAVTIIAVPASPQPKSRNDAIEVKCSELGKISNSGATNCPECLKDTPATPRRAKPAFATENPNSPAYYHRDKNTSYHMPPIKAGDNGHLLEVDLTAPGTIFDVVYDCHGHPCGWVHPCDGAQCVGHNVPVEYHNNNTATWWGWSNSGDNAELVFIVHYQ